MTELSDYLARHQRKTERDARVHAWHLKAHVEGGLPLPYDHTQTYIDLNVWDEDGDKVDAEKSIDRLAAATTFAVREGAQVEKNYDHDFELVVTLPGEEKYGLRVTYYASREAVCTKRVVGSKVIAERTIPARTEEIVEWDCHPISLLAPREASV